MRRQDVLTGLIRSMEEKVIRRASTSMHLVTEIRFKTLILQESSVLSQQSDTQPQLEQELGASWAGETEAPTTVPTIRLSPELYKVGRLARSVRRHSLQLAVLLLERPR